MKNISTGAGLVVLGLGIALHPLASGFVAQATAAPASSSASAAAAVAPAATAQAGPTVVWYQAMELVGGWAGALNGPNNGLLLVRAWSDGTVEARIKIIRAVGVYDCENYPQTKPFVDVYPACNSGWFVVSSPDEGFKAAADTNADQRIDGVDLAAVLGSWGDAPRVPFPPSDCPLNLINP